MMTDLPFLLRVSNDSHYRECSKWWTAFSSMIIVKIWDDMNQTEMIPSHRGLVSSTKDQTSSPKFINQCSKTLNLISFLVNIDHWLNLIINNNNAFWNDQTPTTQYWISNQFNVECLKDWRLSCRLFIFWMKSSNQERKTPGPEKKRSKSKIEEFIVTSRTLLHLSTFVSWRTPSFKQQHLLTMFKTTSKTQRINIWLIGSELISLRSSAILMMLVLRRDKSWRPSVEVKWMPISPK